MRNQTSEYGQQAADFLDNTNSKLYITYIRTGTHFPGDTASRDIFSFSLSNHNGSYTAEFGDSIAACQERKSRSIKPGQRGFKPSAYDILACLNPHSHDSYPTLGDFINGFGYTIECGADLDRAQTTYSAVVRESRALAEMYDDSELAMLAEIN